MQASSCLRHMSVATGTKNHYTLRQGLSYSRRSSFSSNDSENSTGSTFSQESVVSSATSGSAASNRRERHQDAWEIASFDNEYVDHVSRYAALVRASAERPSQNSTVAQSSFESTNSLEGMCNDGLPCSTGDSATHPKRIAMANPRRSATSDSWQKPTLVRDTDRRELLVERLVDSSTQLVSLVWPQSDADGTSRGLVIPLRMFIKETLKRSRTSYSTLQLTLYYLILIKSKNSNSDSLKCGRRMFLTALILASKYLQDRNFSSKAWSKISGLKSHEINSNESAFLAAIDWQLHLKAAAFEQWSEIVGKCTDLAQYGASRIAWKAVLNTVKANVCLDQMRSALSSPSSSYFFTTPMAITPPAEASNLSFSGRGTVNTCTHVPSLGSQPSSCALSALLTASDMAAPAAGENVRSLNTSYNVPYHVAATTTAYGRSAIPRPLTPPQTPPDEALSAAAPPSSFTSLLRERPQLRSAWPTPTSSSPASTISSTSCGDIRQYPELRLPSIRDLVSTECLTSTSTFATSTRYYHAHETSVITMIATERASKCKGLLVPGRSHGVKRTFNDSNEHVVPATTCKRTCGKVDIMSTWL